MTNDQEWLANLKVGDEVAVVGRGISLATVSNVLKMYVMVGRTKYRKSNGWQTGDGYFRNRIEYPCDQHREVAHRQRLVCAFQYLKTDSLTTDQLARIIAIAKEPKEAAE